MADDEQHLIDEARRSREATEKLREKGHRGGAGGGREARRGRESLGQDLER